MALSIGKLTVLVGAGIFGSVLAKEGRMPQVSDFFSGTFKVALKQIRQDDSTQSTSKPHNDSLLAQVNNLRQELQMLSASRPVTIVTSSGSGGNKYGVVIVIVVVGYGYIWWKGWKLSNMMFATRHSLSQASSKIAKQLEMVYSSIEFAKRHLSSQIDGVNCNLEDCVELTALTRDEVTELHGDVKMINEDVQSVHNAVQTLEMKFSRIEGKQDLTNEGVIRLCDYAWSMENKKATERLQASPSSSSQLTLESPRVASLPAANSFSPAVLSLESSPSSSSGPYKVHRRLHSTVSASAVKGLHGISMAVQMSGPSEVPNEPAMAEERDKGSFSLFGRKLPALTAFLSKKYSETHMAT